MSKLADTVESHIKTSLPKYTYTREYAITLNQGKETTLFFDFCVPGLRVMIEVQGEQHFKFNSFFHGTMDNFNKAKSRDSFKQEWCSNNNYTLVYFNYDEIEGLTGEEFLQRIIGSNLDE